MDQDFEITVINDKKILHNYKGNLEHVRIPDFVEIIGDKSFRNNSLLKTIVIPNSVTNIKGNFYDGGAFQGCTNLISIEIPSSVENIGANTFNNCSNLKSVIISEGVKQIGDFAFARCTSLSPVLIPKSIEAIGLDSFIGAENVEVGIYYFRQETEKEPRSFYALNNKYINLVDQEKHQIGKLFNLDKRIYNTSYFEDSFFQKLLTVRVTHLSEYDQLFQQSDKTVIKKGKAALCRLQYPLELDQEYKDEYISYLKDHGHFIIPFLIKENDIVSMSILTDIGAIQRDNILEYIDKASQLERTEILAFLMDYKNKTWGVDPVPIMKLTGEEYQDNWLTMENDDGSLTIKKYLGKEVNVTIPSRIMNKPVKTINGWNIGDILINVFSTLRDKIKSVVIEDGIVVIGERAFLECHNLSSIMIPASVIEVGKEAFYGCENLVIHAPKGSYAIQYARENDIKFEEI